MREKPFKQEDLINAQKKFEELTAKAPEVNLDLLNNEKLKNELQTSEQIRDSYSSQVINFHKTYAPLKKLSYNSLIKQQYNTALEFQKIKRSYEKFNILYSRTPKQAIDIFRLVKLYYSLYPKVVKYQDFIVINKMKVEIENKISTIDKIITDFITFKGFENLTSTDIFQLQIISPSVEAYWKYFDFENSSFYPYEDEQALSANLRKMYSFIDKNEKIFSIYKKNDPNEYDIKRAIENNIINSAKLETTKIAGQKDKLEVRNIEDVAAKAAVFLKLCEFDFFTSSFKNDIKEEIKQWYSNLNKNVNGHLKKEQYPDNFEFVNILCTSYETFSKYGVVPSFTDNLSENFIANFHKIYQSENPLKDMATNIFSIVSLLTGNIDKENRKKFESITEILFNSIFFLLSTSYTPNHLENKFVFLRNLDSKSLPDFKKNQIQIEPREAIFNSYIFLHSTLELIREGPFNKYAPFIEEFPIYFARIFYDIEQIKDEKSVEQIGENTEIIDMYYRNSKFSSLQVLVTKIKDTATSDFKKKSFFKGFIEIFKK